MDGYGWHLNPKLYYRMKIQSLIETKGMWVSKQGTSEPKDGVLSQEAACATVQARGHSPNTTPFLSVLQINKCQGRWV
jgi:hypothetical protein